MSHCPLHIIANACSHWWILRPLYKAVRIFRKLTGEEDLRRCAINALYLKPGERVLNMCCGTGDDLHLLVGRDLELYAADAKQVYAEAGRFEVRCNQWHNVRVFHWTDGRLPLPTASVDAILISYGLTGTDNPGCVIAECKRLLKPNGRLVVVDWVTPNKGNTIISGLLWPLHAMMGCNPYTHWRRQFARAFEVCREQAAFASLITLTIGRQRAAEAPHQPNLYELPLDPIEEPTAPETAKVEADAPVAETAKVEANAPVPETAKVEANAPEPETAKVEANAPALETATAEANIPAPETATAEANAPAPETATAEANGDAGEPSGKKFRLNKRKKS